ncbi:hypothetical protein EN801_020445 [Mesorhizobium sp. M00.F.Ca.ET.158.01.1.1]|nr:hypothetical protein EN801_020445 [Mesorhizobium sp. M00.F.Ca.ET.158.01.1.1]
MLKVLPVGLLLAGVLPLTNGAYAQPTNENGSSQQSSPDKQELPNQSGKPVAPPSLKDILQSIANAIEAGNDKPQSAEERANAQRDLAAQEDMAKWAKYMLIIGLAEAVITATGVVLVWRTLLHTRDAAIHAGKAVKEARNAIEADHPPHFEIRQIGLQLAEWLDGNERTGELFVFNGGATDATLDVTSIAFHTGKHPPPKRPFDHAEMANPLRDRLSIFAGGEGAWWKFTGNGCTATDDEIRAALTAQDGTKFFIIGRIHFWDRQSIYRHKVFCRVYDPTSRRFIETNDADYEYHS